MDTKIKSYKIHYRITGANVNKNVVDTSPVVIKKNRFQPTLNRFGSYPQPNLTVGLLRP